MKKINHENRPTVEFLILAMSIKRSRHSESTVIFPGLKYKFLYITKCYLANKMGRGSWLFLSFQKTDSSLLYSSLAEWYSISG